MMLKEKSSKWARLKLLLLLPLGTLAVLAFARPEVNEPASPSTDYESTINSGENEIVQSPLQKDNPQKQKVIYARMGDKGEVLYAYPAAYDEAKEGEKPIHDKFVKYTVAGKEYTQEEFEKLINGKVFVENKEDIKSGETDAMEFYCTTQKGLKTPTWYMVKVKEGTTWKDLENEYKAKESNRLKSIVNFTPPVIIPDNNGTQQKKAKPNYYKYTEYEVDGKIISLAEYEKLKANSLEILHEEYIPFAKGKVVKITGVFNTGKKADHSSYREMFVDGKAPDRSHVEFIINDVMYNYAEGSKRASGVKYATLEDAKKARPANSALIKTCQIRSKDGSRSSKVFYVVSFVPPVIKKDTDNK